ncbi:sulfatase-like hydrolase/transferase, partial [Verrucomicrobiales bacterium]|nr:sulfatase-like hydrolase/transferase [Verrucomicrobiales bacterium]
MKFRWLPLLFLTLFVATHAQAEDKPNVLWIYLEDVSGWFSCYGDKVIETPNIDALAADGVRFDRFYVSAGVCSAMRSGTIVGMMQTSVGAHNHRSCRATFRGKSMGEYDKNVLPESVKPVPQIFKEAGFYTFNEGTGKDDFNFEWDSKELYDRAAGPEFKGAKDGTDWSGRAEGQPFFGQIQLMGGKYKKLKPVTDRAKVPVPPYYPDVPEVRESIAYHYDCLLKVDAEVGKIVAGLKRDGLYENTYIMMFSDHGYGLHRHKQMVYDGGIHMPLTVSGPNIAGK